MSTTTLARRSPLPFRILSPLKEALQSRSTFLGTDSIIVLVCGAGSTPDGRQPLRDVFVEYARRHLTPYRFYYAEDVFHALHQRHREDLLEIESKLADFSDCVLVFLESAGALAELGAFSLSDSLVKKLLPVSDTKYSTDNSFINQGPLDRINKRSRFRPALHASFSAVLRSAPAITDRLQLIERKHRKRVAASSYEDFRRLPGKERMLLLADLIQLLHPVTHGELLQAVAWLYDLDLERDDLPLHVELALLVALGLVTRSDRWYLRTAEASPTFFHYGNMDAFALRARVISFAYRKAQSRLRPLTHRALQPQ